MQIAFVEPTPNPNALKFNLDGPALPGGARNYASPEAAGADPLARTLFALPGVENVFYTERFVSVSKRAQAPWEDLQPRIEQTLTAFDAAQLRGANGDGAAAGASAAAASSAGAAADPDELLAQIKAVIDERIAPALAMDGGGLVIHGLDQWTLRISYQGACGSCPSSSAGTLMAIERMIKERVDERLTVVNV